MPLAPARPAVVLPLQRLGLPLSALVAGVGASCHDRAVEFSDQDLSGARFDGCLLSGAVIRGSDLTGMELDDPYLHRGSLWVNGVDVVPFVERELNRRAVPSGRPTLRRVRA